MSYDYQCGTCYKTFMAGWRARENHFYSTGHAAPDFECSRCAANFSSNTRLFNHMNAANHFRWNCSLCPETWPTEDQRISHEHFEHYYCHECDRPFMNYNNLKMHLNSRLHRSYDIKCPFCNRSHQTATGLTYHVETGSCPNAAGLNRDTLYKFIRQRDTKGVLTNNLLEYTGSRQYQATSRSYNENIEAWECSICHRLFNTVTDLNKHLNSPTHQANLYHCPNRNCEKQFKTLAAFVNHLESESCGFMHFGAVQCSIENVIGGGRLIGY
ncbi:hypothetical protein GGR50DRAFT_307194 [Xylaria sp. CBS 124048]|nr:hypothetical protein GGR50DRAFT_307194 [Xylaria sp. CBS 124048]